MGRRGNTPGRLRREENPQSGTVPGFTPQYFEDDRHPREVSDEYPYPTKDTAVESRLNELLDKQADIIEKQADILERLNEPIDTKLTGSNVEEEVLERSIRSSNTYTRQSIRNGSIGMVVVCSVYSVTGSFSDSQGLSLSIRQNSSRQTHNIITVDTETLTDNRPHVVYWYPNANLGDASIWLPGTRDVKTVGLPLSSTMEFSLVISGDFDDGQGFDCRVDVEWLY